MTTLTFLEIVGPQVVVEMQCCVFSYKEVAIGVVKVVRARDCGRVTFVQGVCVVLGVARQ